MKRLFIFSLAILMAAFFNGCGSSSTAGNLSNSSQDPKIESNKSAEVNNTTDTSENGKQRNIDNTSTNNTSENSKKTDNQIILEYLNEKTDDILKPDSGKLYSAFDVLGKDKDKLYIWLLKSRYVKENGKMESSGGVSIPVVLYISYGEKGIEIKGHEAQLYGDYSIWKDKMIPNNIKHILDGYETGNNGKPTKLQEIINTQVEMDNKN